MIRSSVPVVALATAAWLTLASAAAQAQPDASRAGQPALLAQATQALAQATPAATTLPLPPRQGTPRSRPQAQAPGPIDYKILTASSRGTYIQIGRDLARFVAPPA